MTKALVVGGNGFLGSHLVDRLVSDGYTVSVFDRFSSGTPRYSAEGVHAFQGDFGNRGSLKNALAGQQLVFHFLSRSTPATSSLDPMWDLRENVVPTIELFEMAAAAKVEHLYFASSGGAVYGDQPGVRLAESSALFPVSPYAIGKATIENFLRFFRQSGQLSSTVFRISNPYGPGQLGKDGHGLIPNAVRRIRMGQPVVQYGDGEMVRDFVYIADLIEMVIRCVSAEKLEFDTYNLGGGVGSTVSQVLDLIERQTGPFERISAPTPQSYVSSVVLDTSRFASEFNYSPSISLESGIRSTIRFLDESWKH